MEWVKLILNFVTSWFNNSTQKKKEELKLADAVEELAVEKMKSASNARAVQQQAKVQDALDKLEEKHKEERQHAKENPNADDEQFGNSW